LYLMSKRTVTLIPGDGIGPEITDAVKKVFGALQAPIEWEEVPAGMTAMEEYGELLPKALLDSVARNRVVLKGPITTPIGEGFRSVNIELRQHFDLFASIRPCKSVEAIPTPYQDVDLIVIRENTEGLYAGLEYYDERLGIIDTIARITHKGCERIVRAGFEYAKRNGRKRVTLVHKANILKQAGAAFLRAGKMVAPEYDVIVTTNLFGDILSDLAAGLVGGLGVAAGANIGTQVAMFEAVHGSAPDIAGKNIANPTALLKSGVMMLTHLGEAQLAQRLEAALDLTLQNKDECTRDLGGLSGTDEFADHIIRHLEHDVELIDS
jgi:isocitrate dehydrogenase (NAD+)